MKKIVALFICLLMVCSMSVVAFAGTTTANVEKSEYHRGDSFTVDVAVKDLPEATTISFAATYDNTVYELVSGAWASTLPASMLADVDAAGNAGVYLFAGGAKKVADGSVLTLNFKVKDDAELNVTKDISIDVQYANSDADIGPTASTPVPASIKIACLHNWEKVDTVAATCGEDGYTNYKCSECGETKKDDVVPATGNHTVGSVLNNEQVPATCTTPGKSPYICSVCGKRIENEQPALGHDEILLESECVEPTYTAEGKNVYVCTRCNEMREEVLPKKTVEVISVADGKEIAKNEATVIERDGKLYIVAPEVEGYTATVAEIEVVIGEDGVIAPVTFEYTPNPVDSDNKGDDNKPATDGNKPATGDKNPPMGDNMIFVVIALAVVACASAAVIVVRRRKTDR